MQPVIRPTNKANRGPDNHGAKLVNSNGQWLDHSSGEETSIDDKRKGDPDKNVAEEISDRSTLGRPRTKIPRPDDVSDSVRFYDFSDC